jgi:hopanoid biosynthesis associated protein HpnK
VLKLLVHADDFGLSARVNEGISLAHRGGILTSTSLLANGGAFADAVRIGREVPTLDVGVHLTLVEDAPVLDAERVPTLVDETGKFYRHATVLAKRWLMGKVSVSEVRAELQAQIEKVLDSGLRVTHLDGHQHAHMLPDLLAATGELASRYGIRWIRFPGERLRAYMLRPSEFGRIAQLLALNLLCLLGRRVDARSTDHFAGFFFGGRLDKHNLLTLIDRLPSTGSCELMCHPGTADPSSSYAHWNYRWGEELAALIDKDVARALAKRGVQLVSYRDLKND